MANLGKIVTAVGAFIVFVFALVGLITIAAADAPEAKLGIFVTNGLKAVAIVEGILLMLVAAGVGATAFLPVGPKLATWSPVALAVLILVTVLPFKMFAMLGVAVALAGVYWAECVPASMAGNAPVAAPAPESKL
jgi:hypothetical protein